MLMVRRHFAPPGFSMEDVRISKEEYLALGETRDLVIRFFGRLNRAFSEDADLPTTMENERQRLVGALWSIAAFLGKGGFDLPFAHRFFELGSAIGSGAGHPRRPAKARSSGQSPAARPGRIVARPRACGTGSRSADQGRSNKGSGSKRDRDPVLRRWKADQQQAFNGRRRERSKNHHRVAEKTAVREKLAGERVLCAWHRMHR